MNDVESKLRALGERTARDHAYREAPAGRIVRRARLRRALTVGAPVLAVVLFAGVALPRVDWPGERPETSVAMLTGAVDATEEEGSARIEVEFEFEMDSGVRSSVATGVVDFGTGRTLLEVVYSTGEERVVETITDGTRVFERPADSPDAKWTEADLPPGALDGVPGSEPTELLRYIESVASEVTKVGAEVRDGVRVTHYRAVLDPAKVAAASGRETPDGLEVETEPMDVWVDEQGRLRETTFGGTATMDDFSQTIRGSVRFFDFGTPVDIELPEPDEIEEAPATPDPNSDDSTTPPGTYITGARGLAEPHLVVQVRDDGSGLVCVRSPGGEPQPALVVDEVSSEELLSADSTKDGTTFAFVQSYSVLCVARPLSHAELDRLRGDPTRFTLRVGEGPDQVVVELAEVRGYL